MGRHLDKLKKLDQITGNIQKEIRKLHLIAKEGLKHPDKELALFAYAFAWLNYQFSIYLITKFPKSMNADKIDKEFGKIMKNFDRRKKKPKKWWKNKKDKNK